MRPGERWTQIMQSDLTLDADPSADFLHELGFVYEEMKTREADVIALLAKEVAGHNPVFALDFEALHSYLFPRLQSESSRIPPRLIAYVINNSPCPLVLPPGTVCEVVAFAARYFPLVEAFERSANRKNDGSGSHQQQDLLARYHNLFRNHSAVESDVADEESFFNDALKTLAELSAGFMRLNQLVESNKIQSLDKFFPSWKEIFSELKHLIPSIA
jgi:hypothetical protein